MAKATSNELITSTDKAAGLTGDQAVEAYDQDTFAVGGLLVRASDGKLVHAMHNNVIVDDVTLDPTAHGERQMVDWYYAQKKAGADLPPPEELVIVTSLDPCCMCTGSIVTGGFRALVSANDTFAGINYDKTGNFPSVTNPEKLQSTFSYPAVLGRSSFSRKASCADVPPAFKEKHIEEHTQVMNACVFEAKLAQIREHISGDVKPDPNYDVGKLPDSHEIVVELRKAYDGALRYRLKPPGTPDMGVVKFVQKAQQDDREHGGNGDVAALFDFFGNLILCAHGELDESPIKTPFMLLTRTFQAIKHDLIVTKKVKDAEKYLLHPKYGVILFLRCPNDSFRDLVDWGGYGSTMEGPLPEEAKWPNFQYVQKSTLPDVQAYADRLPPFYSTLVKIAPVQVTDTDLREAFEPVPPPQ